MEGFAQLYGEAATIPLARSCCRNLSRSKPISVYPKVFQDADGFYGVDHVFSSTGRYVVDILLNGEYVFTYTIRVLKG